MTNADRGIEVGSKPTLCNKSCTVKPIYRSNDVCGVGNVNFFYMLPGYHEVGLLFLCIARPPLLIASLSDH